VAPPAPEPLLSGPVTRVVDGDTIHVRLSSRPRERVRLLGIDAPEVYENEKLNHDAKVSGRSKGEIQALGRLASSFAREYLAGASVRLELDVQTRDRYGRLLAYVWLSDGRMFNLLSLREGYAQVLTIPPNVKHAALLLACQREAREARRGLWKR
jgi:micrococcal nuclease